MRTIGLNGCLDSAADLVRLKVDVIAAAGTLAPLAAKQASFTIPIVMTAAGDPLGSGLVASLARPDGNVTGMSLMAPDLGGKRSLHGVREFAAAGGLMSYGANLPLTSFGVPPAMLTKSSRVPTLPNFLSNNQRASNSASISKSPKRWASLYRQ